MSRREPHCFRSARFAPFAVVGAATLALAAVAVAAVITGTNGPDVIRGTNQADQISALDRTPALHVHERSAHAKAEPVRVADNGQRIVAIEKVTAFADL